MKSPLLARSLATLLLFSTASADASPPELSLKSVEFGRTGGSGLAFRLTLGATPDPTRMRLLFDVDGSERGEAGSGADYMIEGGTFYRHPGGTRDWKWEMVGPVAYTIDGAQVTGVLSDARAVNGARVIVQATTPEWAVASRWPTEGAHPLPDRAALPEMKVAGNGGALVAEDLSELIGYQPASLSVRFERDFSGRPWKALEKPASLPAWPLTFRVTDVTTGQTEVFAPAKVNRDGDALRLQGRAADLDWDIVLEPAGKDRVTVSGRVRGEGERCLSVTAALEMDPTGWTWHDDVRDQRAITAGAKPFAALAGSPYGAEGLVSNYPFAVISRDDSLVMAETALDEPRVFRIAADPTARAFGITWDLAISPGTKKFPGAATFRGTWSRHATHGANAFRRALEIFYAAHPDFARNRAKIAGLWMPFSDISKLPNPADFGFAFFEKVGDAGRDVEFAEESGILTLRYTEPWLYWLPMPAGMERTPAQAMNLMRQVAAAGNARPNAFAASGLLGGAREVNGDIRMKFLDVPWNSGARMEVSTDPDLAPTPEAPLNRAMAEWRDIQGFLADQRVDGIYLDSMSAMMEMDYNPAAIAAADYPLTFNLAQRRPGLSTQIASYELTAALSRWLHARDQLVMANFPVTDFPFYMAHIDIPGEETTWFAAGKYTPLSERKLNYRRAMSGRKTWCFILGAKFEEIPEGGIERYFRDCLFYGFTPSFFSHNGADEPYWENPALYERDRPLFRAYVPLINRMALAGWRPVGTLRAADEALWVENFGDGADGAVRHLTLRNPGPASITSGVRFAEAAEKATPLVALEPLTGAVAFVLPGEATPVTLTPGEVRAWDLAPAERLGDEIAFLETWTPPHGQGKAGAENLRSVEREIAAGVFCQLRVPTPAVQGEENRAELEVRNVGKSPVTVRGFGPQSVTVAAGATARAATSFREAGADGWLAFAWEIVPATGQPVASGRTLRPTFAPAVEVGVEADRVVSRTASAALDLRLTNRSATARPIVLTWDGEFPGGATTETLQGGESRSLQLPVNANGEEKGFMTIVARSGETEIFRRKVFVVFAGENSSAAAVSGVQVITDSTYPGYATVALTDGVSDGTNLAWNEAAWASDDAGQPHFVRVVFPEPTEIKEATIYWHAEGGVRYTSRRGSLVGVTAEGEEVPLGEFSNNEPVATTRITFPSRKWKSIELRQPPNAGAPERPGILWLSEFELK